MQRAPRSVAAQPGLLSLAALLLTLGSGCASSRPVDVSSLTPTTQEVAALEQAGLTPAQWVQPVEAAVTVPARWSAEPLKVQPRSRHQVWLSPSGSTAFGVLNVQHFLLPLASDERVMDEFLKAMKESEGESKLLEGPVKDRTLAGGIGGLRFVAEGGQYKVRANLVSRGTRAWIVYAGTRRGQEFVPEELAQAEEARERAVLGLTEPPPALQDRGRVADAGQDSIHRGDAEVAEGTPNGMVHEGSSHSPDPRGPVILSASEGSREQERRSPPEIFR